MFIFLELKNIDIADMANKATQYHRTKFQLFPSIIQPNTQKDHGATNIPDGAAFLGSIQIHITPPHT